MSHAHTPSLPPIIITHKGGLRFDATVGGHELILDQPVRAGGENQGPSPIELLGAALGGCAALYVHKFLASRDLFAGGMRVEVTQCSARRPHRIARFDVRIVVGETLPMIYRSMIENVVRACPVYNTLILGSDIGIVVESETGSPQEAIRDCPTAVPLVR